MRFLDFRLNGFAQHRATALAFVDGTPSVILGPNESGKSLLLTGLIGTLFGLPDSEPYRPWTGEPILTGALRLDIDGHEILIERDFAESRVTVTRDGTQIYQGRGLAMRHTAEDERYRALLSDWFGMSDLELFQRLVFVKQDRLVDKELGQRSAEIKRLISGSREASYESALGDLGKDLDRLTRLPGKRNDREIEQLQHDIDDLEARAQSAARDETAAIELEEEEHRKSEELRQIRERQGILETLIDSFGRRRELVRKIEQQTKEIRRLEQDLAEATGDIQRRRELEAQVDRLRVPGDPDTDAIRRDSYRLERAIDDCERIGREVATLEAELRGTPTIDVTKAPSGAAAGPNIGLLALAAVMAVMSTTLGVLVNPILFAGLILAVALAWSAFRANSIPRTRISAAKHARLQLATERLSERQAELEQARANQRAIEARCARWLEQSDETDLEQLIARLSRFGEIQTRLSELRNSDSAEIERYANERSAALTSAAILTTQLEQLERAHPEVGDLTPERIIDHQGTLRRLETEAKRSEEALSDVLVRKRVLQSTSADNAAALNVLIRDKRDELGRKQRLAQALELAIETMQACVQDFQESALEPVAAQAGELMRQITDGRYERVEIDQQSMIPAVALSDSRTVNVEGLSRGAQDQVHLAIRVGLVDALSGGRNLPLIFDDPCVHFDDERLAATVKLLDKIACERQVVILTKDESYLRWYEPVLRLERQQVERLVNISE